MKYIIKPTLILMLVTFFTSINNDAFTQIIHINATQTEESHYNNNTLTIEIDMELTGDESSVETMLDKQIEESLINLGLSSEFKDEIREHFKSLYLNAIDAENKLLGSDDRDQTAFSYYQDMTITEAIYETPLYFGQMSLLEQPSHSEIFRNYLISTLNDQDNAPVWETLYDQRQIFQPSNHLNIIHQNANQTKAGYKLNKYFSLESDYIHHLMNPKKDTITEGIPSFISGSIISAFMKF